MKKNEYQTKDLYEAALLYAKEIPLIKLSWVENKCFFVFKDQKTSNKITCEKLSQDFWNGDLAVNSMDYVLAIKHLKERIFARK